MPRKPRQLPAQNTLPYLLLTLTALCGEYPIRQISRLLGGSAYLESVVTALRRDGLLRTFSKDGLRGLRLTSSAKRLLLADAPEWFSAYLTGSSEPNKLKSEIPRRLRLHRMAEILTIMHNADIPAFPWEKAPFSAASQSAAIPAYYTSREVKEIGPQGTKIKSSRATGILLTNGSIFLTYNTAKTQMKWEYKAELRFKALLQTEGVMPDAEISGIVFGSTMEQLSIPALTMTGGDGGQHGSRMKKCAQLRSLGRGSTPSSRSFSPCRNSKPCGRWSGCAGCMPSRQRSPRNLICMRKRHIFMSGSA